MSGDRVVLANRVDGFVPYRWTGAEPTGLTDAEVAEQLGATWEDAELVTYDLPSLTAQFAHWHDGWQSDND